MSYRWDSASNCSHVGWNMHRYSNRMLIKMLLLLFTLLCFCCSTAPNFAQKGFGRRSNACRLVQNARKMPLPLTSLAFLARIMWTGIKQQPHGEDSSYTHERVTRLSTSIAPEWPFPFVWSSFPFPFSLPPLHFMKFRLNPLYQIIVSLCKLLVCLFKSNPAPPKYEILQKSASLKEIRVILWHGCPRV